MSARSLIELASQNRVFKRRLPRDFGAARIYVSPDAALRYWRPGRRAFDSMLLGAARERVKAGTVVWDVGANVGVFAIAAAHRQQAGGTVLAVEPDAFLAGLIQRSTTERARGTTAVKVICAALSDGNGIAEFNIAGRGRASNALVAAEGRSQAGGTRHTAVVPVLHPEVLMRYSGPPGFIKLDVEGAELTILHAASDLIEEHHPELLVEVGREDRDEMTDLLRGHGYELFNASDGFNGSDPVDRCCFNTWARIT